MYECFGYTQKHENVSCGMAILLFAHKNPVTILILYIDTTINICYYILVRNKGTAGKELRMNEENNMSVFKSYLRRLLRGLKEIKEALEKEDTKTAKRLIDELIEDTQSGIED